MTAATKQDLVSAEEYLRAELHSPIKHEYLGGVVYAMAGARNVHNRIKGNIYVALANRLRGKRCQPYDSDTKIRIQFPTHVRFYYPDDSVICRENPPHDSFQDEPAVIVEVLSKSTRRIDQGEKKDAYLTVPSLSAYLLVEQDFASVVVFRRSGQDFVREVYKGLDAVIPLVEVEIELPLAEIYENVEFVPEPDEDQSA
jgi:Uma2 family endonuclease